MPKKRPAKEDAKELGFEETLHRIEQTVQLLEDGQIGLSEALGQYEDGVKLLRHAYDLLQRAERKIQLLSGTDAQGNPITEPFDGGATSTEGDVVRRPPGTEPRARGSGKPAGETDIDAPEGLF